MIHLTGLLVLVFYQPPVICIIPPSVLVLLATTEVPSSRLDLRATLDNKRYTFFLPCCYQRALYAVLGFATRCAERLLPFRCSVPAAQHSPPITAQTCRLPPRVPHRLPWFLRLILCVRRVITLYFYYSCYFICVLTCHHLHGFCSVGWIDVRFCVLPALFGGRFRALRHCADHRDCSVHSRTYHHYRFTIIPLLPARTGLADHHERWHCRLYRHLPAARSLPRCVAPLLLYRRSGFLYLPLLPVTFTHRRPVRVVPDNIPSPVSLFLKHVSPHSGLRPDVTTLQRLIERYYRLVRQHQLLRLDNTALPSTDAVVQRPCGSGRPV